MKYTVVELGTTAKSVRVIDRRVIIELQDGRAISFPASANAKLDKADDRAISKVELICNGTGLHWPALDEDLSLLGILEGRLSGKPVESKLRDNY